MEVCGLATSLHRQLREYYVSDATRHEVALEGYRIDAIDEAGRLIEIQCASLAAIRDKIRRLLKLQHPVTVVKPLAAVRRVTTINVADGSIQRSRRSPSKQTAAHIFLELVHFGVFPSPNLQLDVLLTEQEELRLPPTVQFMAKTLSRSRPPFGQRTAASDSGNTSRSLESAAVTSGFSAGVFHSSAG